MYKHQQEERPAQGYYEKSDFNLDFPADKVVIQAFERELEPMIHERVKVFEKELCGFELYLYRKGLMTYNKHYKYGAVCGSRISEYRIALGKMQALGKLEDRRTEAENERKAQTLQLIQNQ